MPTIKITDAQTEPITLEQAKMHLRKEEDDEDTLITNLIKTARQTAEDRLQRTLIETIWMRTKDSFPCSGACIELNMPRVLSVEFVKYIDPDGVLTTMDPAAYEFEPTAEPGLLMPAYGTHWPVSRVRPGAVQVQYKAGYGATEDLVPKPILQWMLLAIADMYANRERSTERPVVPQDFADGLIYHYRITGV